MSSDPSKDLWRGKRVIWRHKPSGGYGYVMRVPVTVVDVRGKMVGIRLENGTELVVQWKNIVDPSDMRHVVPTLEPTQE